MWSADRERKCYAKWHTDTAIHEAHAIAGRSAKREGFARVLGAVLHRSELLRPGRVASANRQRMTALILHGLLALANYRKQWLCDPYEWHAPDASRVVQFGSLAQHLLTTHPVPAFMSGAWLTEPSAEATACQRVYRHLGLGNNIRGADLPIKLTRSMANHFMLAPDHLSFFQALRWCQIRGWGGSSDVAAGIVGSRIGDSFEDERFWNAVLPDLISLPGVDRQSVPTMVEFLHAHRAQYIACRQPSELRRQLRTLQEDVRRWVRRRRRCAESRVLSWPRISVAGYETVAPRKQPWLRRRWLIRELTTSDELVDEGRVLHHCVATYIDACARRETSIWSMRCQGGLGIQRCLTIQVDPHTRTILAALGSHNSSPEPLPREILKAWARQEQLKFESWV